MESRTGKKVRSFNFFVCQRYSLKFHLHNWFLIYNLELSVIIGIILITWFKYIAGVRRIEAVAGPAAVDLLRERDSTVKQLCGQLKVKPEELPARIQSMQVRHSLLQACAACHFLLSVMRNIWQLFTIEIICVTAEHLIIARAFLN